MATTIGITMGITTAMRVRSSITWGRVLRLPSARVPTFALADMGRILGRLWIWSLLTADRLFGARFLLNAHVVA